MVWGWWGIISFKERLREVIIEEEIALVEKT